MDGVGTETQVVGNMLRLTSFKLRFLYWKFVLSSSPNNSSIFKDTEGSLTCEMFSPQQVASHCSLHIKFMFT